MNKILKEITDDTLRTIRSLDIVLPEVYRDIFASMAKARGVDIDSIDTKAALDYALEKTNPQNPSMMPYTPSRKTSKRPL